MNGIDLVVILGALVLFWAVICTALWFRFRRYKVLHETLRIMVEKGAPIPPELLNPPELRSGQRGLRSGLVWLAIGIGAMTYFLIEDHNKWPLALIPLLVGIAFLVNWVVADRKAARK